MEECGKRAMEVVGSGSEGGNEVGGEFMGCGRIRWRTWIWKDVKVVELDWVAGFIIVNPPEFGLPVVGGTADEVDRNVKAGEEVGEVEQLV